MTAGRLVLVIAVTALASVAATILTGRLFQNRPRSSEAATTALHSDVLGERREYSVHLPEGYDADSTARYPVLYVLDGSIQAGHTAESASFLARLGVAPPMIVVGIPNVDGDSRHRDFTPPDRWSGLDIRTSPDSGAARFLTFLQKELMVRVESEYRTARPRMLAGWSRSGLFVLYSQIAAPFLFDGRFAHSPFVWSEEDERAVARLEAGLSAAAPPDTALLYLSLGDQETQTMQSFRRAVRALESHAPPALRWRADVSEGGSHETNVRLSTPVGLCAMFAPRSGLACRPATAASAARRTE